MSSVRHESSARRGLASATARPQPTVPAAGVARDALAPLREASALIHTMLRLSKINTNGEDDARVALNLLARTESILQAYAHAAQVDLRPPHLRPADFTAIAQETVLLLAGSAREGTRFDLDQGADLLPVFADTVQLAQVVSTLALVASESAGKHPRVAISTGREPNRSGPSRVFARVFREGAPLSKARLDELFSPDSARASGAGVGLYIVERIIAAHGGELQVESPRPGATDGISFTVLLPELIEYQI